MWEWEGVSATETPVCRKKGKCRKMDSSRSSSAYTQDSTFLASSQLQMQQQSLHPKLQGQELPPILESSSKITSLPRTGTVIHTPINHNTQDHKLVCVCKFKVHISVDINVNKCSAKIKCISEKSGPYSLQPEQIPLNSGIKHRNKPGAHVNLCHLYGSPPFTVKTHFVISPRSRGCSATDALSLHV